MSPTIELADGLNAVCNPIELDGRLSTHPRAFRGFASTNCFLLQETAGALLIDTGLTIHQDSILRALEDLLGARRDLSILLLRWGEFGGICNVRAIAEQFDVAGVHGGFFGEPADWLDFRPDLDGESGPGHGLAGVPTLPAHAGSQIRVGTGSPRLEILVPPMRLIPTPWAYDHVTETLFTGDMFSWVTFPTPAAQWVISDPGDDPTTAAMIHDFLAHGRYWWLVGGNTGRVRSDLQTLLERLPVTTIAPGYGSVLHGRLVVERHLQMLDGVLADLAREPAVGVEAGRLAATGAPA